MIAIRAQYYNNNYYYITQRTRYYIESYIIRFQIYNCVNYVIYIYIIYILIDSNIITIVVDIGFFIFIRFFSFITIRNLFIILIIYNQF